MTRAGAITSMGTVWTFAKGRACSDTLFHVLNRAFGQPPMKLEEPAVMPFAGGIMQHGYQCGMIWGATLAAGAEAYRRFGPGPEAETRAIIAAQRLVESFRARNTHMNCLEITDLDKSSSIMDMVVYFLIKGGTIGCFRMAARYAPVALDAVESAFSDTDIEVPSSPPVSCAAVLAKKIGLSELHTVMTAGLAGGIGLSGGACGALGVAIWIMAMQSKERGGKIGWKDPRALEVIDRFVKSADYELECSEIVGRRFDSVGDHATHLCDGGCSEIIELLAAI